MTRRHVVGCALRTLLNTDRRGDGARGAPYVLSRIVLIVIAVAATFPAFGDSPVIETERSDSDETYAEIARRETFVVSKDLLTTPHFSVFAEASPQENVRNAQDENYDLYVSLNDTRSGTLVASAFFKEKLPNGGGPKLQGIALDNEAYTLSPRFQAFGLRAKFGMGFTWSEELNLFIVKDKEVINILSGAEMQIFFTNRGSTCRLQTREAKRTLAVARNITNGFHDLLVNEKVVDSSERKDRAGNCTLKPFEVKKKTYRLKYNGVAYSIPRDMKEFDCRVC